MKEECPPPQASHHEPHYKIGARGDPQEIVIEMGIQLPGKEETIQGESPYMYFAQEGLEPPRLQATGGQAREERRPKARNGGYKSFIGFPLGLHQRGFFASNQAQHDEQISQDQDNRAGSTCQHRKAGRHEHIAEIKRIAEVAIRPVSHQPFCSHRRIVHHLGTQISASPGANQRGSSNQSRREDKQALNGVPGRKRIQMRVSPAEHPQHQRISRVQVVEVVASEPHEIRQADEPETVAEFKFGGAHRVLPAY